MASAAARGDHRRRAAGAGVAAALALGLTLGLTLTPALARGQCAEPETEDYRDAMAAARAAIEADDFEAALDVLRDARSRHDVALLDYSIARALHRLDRYEEAERAYNTFLNRFEGCPDPQRLGETAREYRALAVQQRRQELAVDDPVRPPGRRGLHPGWLLLGGAGALCVAGVVVDVVNAPLRDDLQAAYDAAAWERARVLEDDRDVAVTLDYVLYGSALAVGVAGALWLLLDRESAGAGPGEGPGAAGGLGVAPLPGGAVVGWTGRF
jgi:tetratricopeptide (TPR) repeat protein